MPLAGSGLRDTQPQLACDFFLPFFFSFQWRPFGNRDADTLPFLQLLSSQISFQKPLGIYITFALCGHDGEPQLEISQGLNEISNYWPYLHFFVVCCIYATMLISKKKKPADISFSVPSRRLTPAQTSAVIGLMGVDSQVLFEVAGTI